jgi:hypothetical protein
MLAIVCWSGVSAAFPIAPPGSEGFPVVVNSTNPIIATYQGNSATYSNDLYLMLDGAGNPGDDGNPANDRFIFNNHGSPVGSTVNLGSFLVGTELIFRLHVQNTGYDYFTGPASRNPDGNAHARVQANWQPNETLVSFEDLLFGPFDYNDLSFSFTNTTPNFPPVPQGFPANNLLQACNVGNQSVHLATSFDSPEANQITTTVVTTDLPTGRYTLTTAAGKVSQQTLDFVPSLSDMGHPFSVRYEATDNGVPPQTTTVVLIIDLDLGHCPTQARHSTWGSLKSLYR